MINRENLEGIGSWTFPRYARSYRISQEANINKGRASFRIAHNHVKTRTTYI
jgi:hypothetical protein